MGDNSDLNLNLRLSPSAPQQYKHALSENSCRSNISVPRSIHSDKKRDTVKKLVEYYKKYEHDEVPVKDSVLSKVEDKRSLTNFELDKLESKIYKSMSQELLIDNNNSVTSLESNIKFFKTTVQNILDNFYNSMQDFELYKKRFHEILLKKDEDAIGDMEDFIKDMIQHIISSETSLTNEIKKSDDKPEEITNQYGSINDFAFIRNNAFTSTSNATITMETIYPSGTNASLATTVLRDNDNDEENDTPDSTSTKQEVCNIYLLGHPCVQIKIHERNPLSEINIKNRSFSSWDSNSVASVENMRRRAAKKLELKKYGQSNCSDNSDTEIPVKESSGKQNIQLEEDIQEHDGDKSLISKLCDYLCRKFRRV